MTVGRNVLALNWSQFNDTVLSLNILMRSVHRHWCFVLFSVVHTGDEPVRCIASRSSRDFI